MQDTLGQQSALLQWETASEICNRHSGATSSTHI